MAYKCVHVCVSACVRACVYVILDWFSKLPEIVSKLEECVEPDVWESSFTYTNKCNEIHTVKKTDCDYIKKTFNVIKNVKLTVALADDGPEELTIVGGTGISVEI